MMAITGRRIIECPLPASGEPARNYNIYGCEYVPTRAAVARRISLANSP
jgi:hypothetical protein